MSQMFISRPGGDLLSWSGNELEKRGRTFDLSCAKRIICLYIPDDFEFMDPELFDLLRERVTPYLETNPAAPSDSA